MLCENGAERIVLDRRRDLEVDSLIIAWMRGERQQELEEAADENDSSMQIRLPQRYTPDLAIYS